MDMMDLILSRKSYRGRYAPGPVPRAHLRQIMEAGLAAPSGCNKQTTSLIAVDDPEVLARLKAVIDPPIAQTAPAAICVLTQKILAYRDRCYQVQDYAAAIENMLLAIHALGYESCWYEGHITDEDRIDLKMAQVLGVPEDYRLVCFLPVGRAAQESRPSPPKKPFSERAWFNGFQKNPEAKKLLLTSAGFENPLVQACFLELLGKPPAEARALFIPTAAIDQDAKAVLPKCRNDLLQAGFLPEHITDFNLDRSMGLEELSAYDTVYFCGGSTEYLLDRVKHSGFGQLLDQALEQGLVYVGVSAGSIIAAGNLPGNLGYLPHRLAVHCGTGSPPGLLAGDGEETVRLTNAQAVKIAGGKMEIIG